jgi:tetratricopeptide (TPR) repeat protein
MGACKTAEFGFKVIDVHGMVYDFSNRPVAHYEIVIGKRYKGSTDINGRFSILKVPVGTYTIKGHKNNFESHFDEVIIKEKGQIIYIRTPSQNQLLNLVEEAIMANNFILANETVERAYQINKNNIEMLFYYAIVLFRTKQYDRAITFLKTAKELGSKDLHIDKFLTVLEELQNEEKTK